MLRRASSNRLSKPKVGAQVDLVQGDVAALSSWAHLRADTVIMNPPFGTRSKGADIAFLQAGIQV